MAGVIENCNWLKRVHIMGVINCTPDSFFQSSRAKTIDAAIKKAEEMSASGADLLDIGGESSRPGSEPTSVEEELGRVIPVVEAVAKRAALPISVDTYKAEVARQALQAGASMINDISALTFDPDMLGVLSLSKAGVVLMHTKGRPKEMQKNPVYRNLLEEIHQFLFRQIALLEQAGVTRDKIIIDPGIGFGKSIDDNYRIINNLKKFKSLGCPLLVGLSRKSFIQKVLQLNSEDCLEGTIAMNSVAIMNGANILRVHDVKEAKRAALVCDYLKKIKNVEAGDVG